MNIKIDSAKESFRKECVERNIRIAPKHEFLYKKLPEAEDCPNPNNLNGEKAAYPHT